jgi:hypothetical protein
MCRLLDWMNRTCYLHQNLLLKEHFWSAQYCHRFFRLHPMVPGNYPCLKASAHPYLAYWAEVC